MQRSKKLPIGDTEITVRELNVNQIKELMDNIEDKEMGTIDLLFGDRIPAAAVEQSTGVSVKKLEEFAPSELDKIITGVEDINPIYANMMKKLSKMGAAILAEKTLTPSAVS